MLNLIKSIVAAGSISVIAMVSSLPALAQALDMSEVTCAEITDIAETDVDTFVPIMFWMDGYLSGVSEDYTFDPDFLEALTTSVLEACAAAPDDLILDVVEEVGLE